MYSEGNATILPAPGLVMDKNIKILSCVVFISHVLNEKFKEKVTSVTFDKLMSPPTLAIGPKISFVVSKMSSITVSLPVILSC